jgi:hypothetical protein
MFKLILAKNKSGSALLLTMFIMAGMLIVAMSGASLVLLGIKAGGIQAQSTRAYYAAEAGSERFLWELRQNGYYYNTPSMNDIIFSSTDTGGSGTLTGGSNYEVYFIDYPPLIFRIIGEYNNNKRSVELRI